MSVEPLSSAMYWGGGVALRFALDYPELIDALVESKMFYFPLLSDDAYLDEAQMLHSWYISMQQDPWLPEKLADDSGEPLLPWEVPSRIKTSPST